MKVIADLHIHSPYSRATSKDITIRNLEKYARMKGVTLLGTGDFTHPKWIEILRNDLKEDGSGILKTNSGFPFMLTTEISNIYTQNSRSRRIHNVILAPDFETVDQINSWLSSKGRLDYDGRPIFGFSCPELIENLKSISDKIEIIPAHVWTPWFSLFGSKSGFDSVEECYEDQAKHIHALETGLSSDPAMNWRLSSLDKYRLVSFSDSHSHWPWRLGREATVFDIDLSYGNIMDALKTGKGLAETIEFFPEEGKYHFDGHRDCNVVLDPKKTGELKGICPVCKKPLTIGVLNRIEHLADRPEGFVPEGAKPFRSLVPLSEIIGFVLKAEPFSKKVWEMHSRLVEGSDELNVLIGMSRDDIKIRSNESIAEMITKIRDRKILWEPGHDGVYGKMVLEKKRVEQTSQKSVFDFSQ